ncbi:MAG: hypothetical protein IJ529_00130 [Alphaproteobacteria bacterium]|nr:hypothetical protein [Alphaproteobacteria bacterium]MBQ9235114.1 hypothetical protein [Alphaproteobacteria bacterium]
MIDQSDTSLATLQPSEWLAKITAAETNYRDYHETIKNIRKYYRNELKKDKQNIFWSSVETLKPFLYFRRPQPFIERKSKSSDKAQTLACRILERALLWNLEQFDFDSVIKYARNDFLISGMGLAIERYKPVFGIIRDADGRECEIKIAEQVNTEYLDPLNFIADSEKVGIWEDCSWFAIRSYMTLSEAVERFGRDITADYGASCDNPSAKSVEVFEVWDKNSSSVLYLSRQFPHRFLKVIKSGLSLSGFFPIPKPLLASTTNDTLLPVPDYLQLKPLLDELDGITSRMEKTMKAIKVSGCYDNAFPELASILNKDVTLVSVSDFDRLKSAGGIKNIVDFMPIDQYVTALSALAQRRQDIIAAIYETTGVSDIMRGSSNTAETATAVVKKTHFGTLRNQDRQNDMNRFISEIFRLKAEIICNQFSSEHLLEFLPEPERFSREAKQAVALLKRDGLRSLVLGVENDASYNEKDVFDTNLSIIGAINTLINQSFDVVSKQPLLLDLYRQMLTGLVAGLSNSRQYESVLDSCFEKIAAEFAQPEAPAPVSGIQEQAISLQTQKQANDYAIKKEQNDLKRLELQLKYNSNQERTAQ